MTYLANGAKGSKLPSITSNKVPFWHYYTSVFLYKTAIKNSLNAGFTTSLLFASNISLLVSTEPPQCMIFSRSNLITIGRIAMKLCAFFAIFVAQLTNYPEFGDPVIVRHQQVKSQFFLYSKLKPKTHILMTFPSSSAVHCFYC